MRRLRDLDDVVDARRVVPLRSEHVDAGVEQLAHRALPSRPKLTTLGRSARDGVCWFGAALGTPATLRT